MVRHKARWIIVEIFKDDNDESENTKEQQKQISSKPFKKPSLMMNNNTDNKVDKNNLFRSLRTTMDSAFGIAAAGMTESIQCECVHYYCSTNKISLYE